MANFLYTLAVHFIFLQPGPNHTSMPSEKPSAVPRSNPTLMPIGVMMMTTERNVLLQMVVMMICLVNPVEYLVNYCYWCNQGWKLTPEMMEKQKFIWSLGLDV